MRYTGPITNLGGAFYGGNKEKGVRHHRPDHRPAADPHFAVRPAAGAGNAVPAAVQLCGHDHRGALHQHRCAGRSGHDLLAEFHDRGLRAGHLQRLRHPGGRELRRKGPGRPAQVPVQRRCALCGDESGLCGGHHSRCGPAAAAHPHPGGAAGECRALHPHHLPGHPGDGAVQLFVHRSAQPGRLEASVLLPAGVQLPEHCAGRAVHRAAGHGRRGRGHRDGDQPARQRHPLHLVVLHQSGGHPLHQRELRPFRQALQAAGLHRLPDGL